MKAKHGSTPQRRGYTEQDICDYAHHLWLQSGMRFDGDPWAEASACLAANLPPAPADAFAPGVVTTPSARQARRPTSPHPTSRKRALAR